MKELIGWMNDAPVPRGLPIPPVEPEIGRPEARTEAIRPPRNSRREERSGKGWAIVRQV